jgi:hypothetical protein
MAISTAVSRALQALFISRQSGACASQKARPTRPAKGFVSGLQGLCRPAGAGTVIADSQVPRRPAGFLNIEPGSDMTATAELNVIDDTAFARLEREGRLLNPVLKAPTHQPGRFGFRGELALRFAPKLADEARPPELTCDQVMAVAQAGDAKIPFFCGWLLSFESLKDVAETLGDTLSAGGKYFLFCDNIDLSKKYQVPYKGAMFYVLPILESTVYNEMLELLYLEKNELKKKDTAGKLDAVANAALKFDVTFDTITYDEGLSLMGPVRNPNENRPV